MILLSIYVGLLLFFNNISLGCFLMDFLKWLPIFNGN